MLITKKTYHSLGGACHPQSTMLRFNNVVFDINDAENILFMAYQFNSTEAIDELVTSFKEYENKNIILDFSCELFSGELFHRMLLEKSLFNVVVYTNGKPPDIRDFNPLYDRGCNVRVIPFFLKYIHYYFPIQVSPHRDRISKNQFLLMVGKLKPERTALVGLLSFYDLLKQNHVSYLTGESNFGPESTEDYFNSPEFPEKQKDLVEVGLNRLESNLSLDTLFLTYDISHSREYNSDYYYASDFVVVCESDASRDVMFITEKIGKCIQLNKKFILLGSKGLLSYTKEQSKIHLNKDISHLTDWCDTSYDEMGNIWDRVDKISEIIKNEIHIREINK